MSGQPYPFADIELARRLERTEAQGNIDFIDARVEAFPDHGATWTEVAGTFAMFDGAGSPLTQTFGLGMLSLPDRPFAETDETPNIPSRPVCLNAA